MTLWCGYSTHMLQSVAEAESGEVRAATLD